VPHRTDRQFLEPSAKNAHVDPTTGRQTTFGIAALQRADYGLIKPQRGLTASD